MLPWIELLGGAAAVEALEVGLPIIAGALILFMLAELAKVWLEPLLSSTATPQGGAILRILDLPGRLIRSVAASAFSAVVHSLSVAASHRMKPLARWFYAAGSLTLATSITVARYADDAAFAVERLTSVVLPRQIGRATRPLSRRAKLALGAALGAAAAVRALRHWIRHVLHSDVLPALRHATHAVDHALPHSIAGLRTRVRRVETQLRKPTRAWLRRIAAAMWLAYLAGAVAKLLARRFPWLFCRKVGTVGRTVCGLDQNLFASLLADVAAIASVISVVAFAREVKAFAEEATPLLQGFVSELAGLPPGEYLD